MVAGGRRAAYHLDGPARTGDAHPPSKGDPPAPIHGAVSSPVRCRTFQRSKRDCRPQLPTAVADSSRHDQALKCAARGVISLSWEASRIALMGRELGRAQGCDERTDQPCAGCAARSASIIWRASCQVGIPANGASPLSAYCLARVPLREDASARAAAASRCARVALHRWAYSLSSLGPAG